MTHPTIKDKQIQAHISNQSELANASSRISETFWDSYIMSHMSHEKHPGYLVYLDQPLLQLG